MLTFAPRLHRRLLEEIARQSLRPVPIAEMNRCVGRAAAAFGLCRPSYERVRVLVHEARARRRYATARVAPLGLDMALRIWPLGTLFLRLAGPMVLAPRLRDRAPPQ